MLVWLSVWQVCSSSSFLRNHYLATNLVLAFFFKHFHVFFDILLLHAGTGSFRCQIYRYPGYRTNAILGAPHSTLYTAYYMLSFQCFPSQRFFKGSVYVEFIFFNLFHLQKDCLTTHPVFF